MATNIDKIYHIIETIDLTDDVIRYIFASEIKYNINQIKRI